MSESTEEAVLVERRGRVMIITLNRPEAMNAINGALSHGLLNAVQELDADDSLTAGVITGNGRGFCSGMDLKAFARGEDIGPLGTFVRDGCNKPLIAAIEGFAIAGGCEIALTCDLFVASKGAKIGIREVKVGLFAAAGGVFRLPARVGYATAMQMAITGEPITAEQALDCGLLSELTEQGGASKKTNFGKCKYHSRRKSSVQTTPRKVQRRSLKNVNQTGPEPSIFEGRR